MSSKHVSGLIAASGVAWASSGRHIVIPFGRILRVFDVSTPEPECTAYLRGHIGAVVSVVAAGNMRVASASEDGTVRVWDIDDGSCLRTIDVGQKIGHMCRAGDRRVLCFGARRIVAISLDRKDSGKHRRIYPDSRFDARVGRIAASTDGSVVAVVDKSNLQITAALEKTASPVVLIRHLSWLTAVAVSEDGSMLAVGDEKGSIFVYPNPKSLFPDSNKTVRLNRSQTNSAALHWHSSAVRGLVFSNDGKLLLSGGAEAALISWKMTKNRFGDRTVLPRLKSPILGISISNDESKYALSQADNSVRVIDQAACMVYSTIRAIAASILGFDAVVEKKTMASTVSEELRNTVRITRDNSERGYLLISGNGGDVQVFDACHARHVHDINVVPRNVVHDPVNIYDGTKSPSLPRVTLVKTSSAHRQMATVDVQKLALGSAGDFGIQESVTTLKFWSSTENKIGFSLSAVFHQPHGNDGEISDVCFHPKGAVAGTSSRNGTLKLWRQVNSVQKAKTASWRCEHNLEYKSLPCHALCFSSDGSLLAAAFGNVLTVWHVHDLLSSADSPVGKSSGPRAVPDFSSPSSLRTELLHALVHPPLEEPVESVAFLQESIPLFITATQAGIYVWNALTQGIWWSSRIRTNPQSLAIDRGSGRFALAVQIPAMAFCEESSANGVKPDNSGETGCGEAMDVEPAPEQRTTGQVNGELKSDPRASRQSSKRKRVKRRDLAVDTSERNGTRAMDLCPTDCAIALFDVMSPVPVKVARLPTDVQALALEFVPTHDSQMDACPVICIDSRLDATLLFSSENDAEEVTGTTELTFSGKSTEASSGKIESLLGNEYMNMGVRGSQPPVPSEDQVGTQETSSGLHAERKSILLQSEVEQAFRLYFHGPTHTQAPVSSKSVDFIRALLLEQGTVGEQKADDGVDRKVSSQKTSQSQIHEEQPRPEQEHRRNSTVAEFESCRAICADLMRFHKRKNKPI